MGYLFNRNYIFFFLIFLLNLFRTDNLYSQCNLLCNTDFEDLQNSPTVIIVDTSLVPCWGTTAADNKIEVWHTGFNGVPSYSGNQFIELNAFFVSTLFQNFTTTPGSTITASFAHRGRAGVDVMSVEIGPAGGPFTLLGTFSDGNLAWGYYTVTYTVPIGLGNNYSIRFNSVSAAGGNQAIGNFLDAISVDLPSNTTLSLTSTPVSCSGMSNGTAQVAVSGGASPFTYSWSPSGGNLANATGLASGIYTVHVGEVNGCSKSGTVSVTAGSSLTLTATSQSVSCFGGNDGSAQINVSGALAPYSYTWSPSGLNTSTISSLTAGVYTVNVASANGCISSKTVSVAQGAPLNMTVTSQSASCFGASDGSAQISVSGGVTPYSYTWSPSGLNTSSVSSLTAGVYTVNVASSNGCVGSKTVSVGQGAPLSMTVTSQNTSCFGASDGSAQVSVSGGVTPYSYTWSPSGINSYSIASLSQGQYSVSVTSANGCSQSQTVSVNNGSSFSLSITSQSVSCFGASDGSAQVTVTGGTGINTYTWLPIGGNSANATGLSSGTYTVQVSTSNGCSGSSTVSISQGAPLSISVSSQSVSCLGAVDGSAQVNVNGGVGPYSYTWTPSGLNTASVSGLASGNYTVQTISSNGCIGSQTVFIAQGLPLNLSVVAKDISCFGLTDGDAQVYIVGGTAPYSYTWIPSGLTTTSISSLSSGTYSVQVTSSNGCSGIQTFSIAQPAQLNSSVTTQSVSCTGSANGSAQVYTTGGIAPYTYSWSPLSGNTSSVTGLAVGGYTCVIYDSNLCTNTVTLSVSSLPSPTIAVNSPTVCEGMQATFYASGANTYTWYPENKNGPVYISSPTTLSTYTLIGENYNGCKDTVVVSAYINPKPNVFAGNDTTVNMDELVTLVGTSSDFYGWIPMNGGLPLNCNYCHEITENPQVNTCYVLEARNIFNCRNTDTVCVTITNDWNLYIPNAFTPNGNDINDVFIPVGYGISELELLIFDRWGELIFKSDEKNKGWNGTCKNQLCKSDVYVYKVNFKTMNGHEESRVGSVTLLK